MRELWTAVNENMPDNLKRDVANTNKTCLKLRRWFVRHLKTVRERHEIRFNSSFGHYLLSFYFLNKMFECVYRKRQSERKEVFVQHFYSWFHEIKHSKWEAPPNSCFFMNQLKVIGKEILSVMGSCDFDFFLSKSPKCFSPTWPLELR